MHEHKSDTHWSAGIHVHFKFHKRFTLILCHPWAVQTVSLWQRHTLYWSVQRVKIQHQWSRADKLLDKQGCTWTFNAPHSSHMGGCWERLIGVASRILKGMLLRSDSNRLPHEVLTTLMAEVMAILNARPLIPVSTDPDNPTILTPAMILTQKMTPVTAPPGDFNHKDLHKNQFKQVQCLAESFWKRWRQEYLVSLQKRHKWTDDKPSIQVDDVVLMKDSQAKWNDWPIGLVVETLPSKDNKVRKVEVKVVR